MYLRAAHAELNIPLLRQFLRDNPLGMLITSLSSPHFPTLQCSHIPWILDIEQESNETELGRLRGHMARQNPHSKALIEALGADETNGKLQEEVLIMFNGPAHSYVTPKFYTETKPATGKVVPTWNYSAVQVYGKARILHDRHHAETGTFLQRAIEDLSRQSEASMGYTDTEGPRKAWSVGDAPVNYLDLMKKNIIGVEVEITRLEGKWKMSQELASGDRQGTIQGFKALRTELGDEMARTVEERGSKKDATKSAGQRT